MGAKNLGYLGGIHDSFLSLRPYAMVSMGRRSRLPQVHRFAANAAETGVYVNPT
jgi:hypothetical protein